MKAKITLSLLNKLEATGTRYDVHDTSIIGFMVRVTIKGDKSYYVQWARGKKKRLGRVGIMTLEQARNEALRYLSEAREYGEPLAISDIRKNTVIPTLENFIDELYEPWVKTHHSDAVNAIRALKTSFNTLLSLRLDEVTIKQIELLRSHWIALGRKPTTANRNITRLRGLFSRAVEWGFIEVHPLSKLKQMKVDRKGRVRYLTTEEEKALREALDKRDKVSKDHLKPLVILSLNTGMRRGEVFNLKWSDIDLKNKVLTVEGDSAKSGQTRYIPLNKEALSILKTWKAKDNNNFSNVFPSKTGGRLDNVKKAWTNLLGQAKIESFRWHDLRHTFASKLAMKGVPLNTIRELLGHSDLAMTLRYSHLAPDIKAKAVELL